MYSICVFVAFVISPAFQVCKWRVDGIWNAGCFSTQLSTVCLWPLSACGCKNRVFVMLLWFMRLLYIRLVPSYLRKVCYLATVCLKIFEYFSLGLQFLAPCEFWELKQNRKQYFPNSQLSHILLHSPKRNIFNYLTDINLW